MDEPWGMNFGRAVDEGAAVAAPTLSWSEANAPLRKASRILLLASRFKLPYRVLRCAAAAGCEVVVLGTRGARKLRHSRFCASFIESRREMDGRLDLALAEEINDLAAKRHFDIVLPGDAPTTRALIQLKPRLRVASFPTPDLAQFDELNDKWRFGALCRDLNIDYPSSRLFASLAELREALRAHPLATPHIAKPLSMDGSEGCIKLAPGFEAKLSEINYAPILLQEYIEGVDIGASVYCVSGRIINFIAHKFERDAYYSFADDSVFSTLKKLMAHVKADGVFNFDMRRTQEGRIAYLECNPRFYFKIAMSMVVGMNFVAAGLGRHAQSPYFGGERTARFPKACLLAAASFQKLEAESWRALRYVLADPVPYLLEITHLQG